MNQQSANQGVLNVNSCV